MQLAFARAGVSWHDAAIASIHGRPLGRTLLPLLGKPKIGLFTHDGDEPLGRRRVLPRRGLDDYDAWVGESLGAAGERVGRRSPAGPDRSAFDPSNFLILDARARPSTPMTLDDHAVAGSPTRTSRSPSRARSS